jgi:hypothetical protein
MIASLAMMPLDRYRTAPDVATRTALEHEWPGIAEEARKPVPVADPADAADQPVILAEKWIEGGTSAETVYVETVPAKEKPPVVSEGPKRPRGRPRKVVRAPTKRSKTP